MPEHRGWYWPRHLPHRDEPGLVQAITFCLLDSLPLYLMRSGAPRAGNEAAERERTQRCLDDSWGACLLADPRVATIVENTLLFGDGTRYVLLAWVVMPNHIHALIETKESWPLERALHGWKGYTAKQMNAVLERQGPLWEREYHDRYVRDEVPLGNAVLYVHNNPVKAGLVERPEDWRYSSARRVEAPGAPFHVPYASKG
jgi:putative transposase